MKTKKKNIFIIILLIIVVLPILLSFVKCDNSADPVTAETRTQEQIKYSRQVKRANNTTWSGTAIPTSGMLQTIYINTELENENVIEILSGIEYLEVNGIASMIYIVLSNEFANDSLLIQKDGNEYRIDYGNFTTFTPIFDSSEGGWITDTNTINYGFELVSEIIFFDGSTIPIGYNNDLLSSLLSTTSFQEIKITPLNTIFEEIGAGLSGLASAFISLFNGIAPVFWVNNQPTIISIFVLASVILTIGFWGIDKLLKLLKIGLGGKK